MVLGRLFRTAVTTASTSTTPSKEVGVGDNVDSVVGAIATASSTSSSSCSNSSNNDATANTNNKEMDDGGSSSFSERAGYEFQAQPQQSKPTTSTSTTTTKTTTTTATVVATTTDDVAISLDNKQELGDGDGDDGKNEDDTINSEHEEEQSPIESNMLQEPISTTTNDDVDENFSQEKQPTKPTATTPAPASSSSSSSAPSSWGGFFRKKATATPPPVTATETKTAAASASEASPRTPEKTLMDEDSGFIMLDDASTTSDISMQLELKRQAQFLAMQTASSHHRRGGLRDSNDDNGSDRGSMHIRDLTNFRKSMMSSSFEESESELAIRMELKRQAAELLALSASTTNTNTNKNAMNTDSVGDESGNGVDDESVSENSSHTARSSSTMSSVSTSTSSSPRKFGLFTSLLGRRISNSDDEDENDDMEINNVDKRKSDDTDNNKNTNTNNNKDDDNKEDTSCHVGMIEKDINDKIEEEEETEINDGTECDDSTARNSKEDDGVIKETNNLDDSERNEYEKEDSEDEDEDEKAIEWKEEIEEKEDEEDLVEKSTVLVDGTEDNNSEADTTKIFSSTLDNEKGNDNDVDSGDDDDSENDNCGDDIENSSQRHSPQHVTKQEEEEEVDDTVDDKEDDRDDSKKEDDNTDSAHEQPQQVDQKQQPTSLTNNDKDYKEEQAKTTTAAPTPAPASTPSSVWGGFFRKKTVAMPSPATTTLNQENDKDLNDKSNHHHKDNDAQNENTLDDKSNTSAESTPLDSTRQTQFQESEESSAHVRFRDSDEISNDRGSIHMHDLTSFRRSISSASFEESESELAMRMELKRQAAELLALTASTNKIQHNQVMNDDRIEEEGTEDHDDDDDDDDNRNDCRARSDNGEESMIEGNNDQDNSEETEDDDEEKEADEEDIGIISSTDSILQRQLHGNNIGKETPSRTTTIPDDLNDNEDEDDISLSSKSASSTDSAPSAELSNNVNHTEQRYGTDDDSASSSAATVNSLQAISEHQEEESKTDAQKQQEPKADSKDQEDEEEEKLEAPAEFLFKKNHHEQLQQSSNEDFVVSLVSTLNESTSSVISRKKFDTGTNQENEDDEEHHNVIPKSTSTTTAVSIQNDSLIPEREAPQEIKHQIPEEKADQQQPLFSAPLIAPIQATSIPTLPTALGKFKEEGDKSSANGDATMLNSTPSATTSEQREYEDAPTHSTATGSLKSVTPLSDRDGKADEITQTVAKNAESTSTNDSMNEKVAKTEIIQSEKVQPEAVPTSLTTITVSLSPPSDLSLSMPTPIAKQEQKSNSPIATQSVHSQKTGSSGKSKATKEESDANQAAINIVKSSQIPAPAKEEKKKEGSLFNFLVKTIAKKPHGSEDIDKSIISEASTNIAIVGGEVGNSKKESPLENKASKEALKGGAEIKPILDPLHTSTDDFDDVDASLNDNNLTPVNTKPFDNVHLQKDNMIEPNQMIPKKEFDKPSSASTSSSEDDSGSGHSADNVKGRTIDVPMSDFPSIDLNKVTPMLEEKDSDNSLLSEQNSSKAATIQSKTDKAPNQSQGVEIDMAIPPTEAVGGNNGLDSRSVASSISDSDDSDSDSDSDSSDNKGKTFAVKVKEAPLLRLENVTSNTRQFIPEKKKTEGGLFGGLFGFKSSKPVQTPKPAEKKPVVPLSTLPKLNIEESRNDNVAESTKSKTSKSSEAAASKEHQQLSSMKNKNGKHDDIERNQNGESAIGSFQNIASTNEIEKEKNHQSVQSSAMNMSFSSTLGMEKQNSPLKAKNSLVKAKHSPARRRGSMSPVRSPAGRSSITTKKGLSPKVMQKLSVPLGSSTLSPSCNDADTVADFTVSDDKQDATTVQGSVYDNKTKRTKKKKKKKKDDLIAHIQKAKRKVSRHGDDVSVGSIENNVVGQVENVIFTSSLAHESEYDQKSRPWESEKLVKKSSKLFKKSSLAAKVSYRLTGDADRERIRKENEGDWERDLSVIESFGTTEELFKATTHAPLGSLAEHSSHHSRGISVVEENEDSDSFAEDETLDDFKLESDDKVTTEKVVVETIPEEDEDAEEPADNALNDGKEGEEDYMAELLDLAALEKNFSDDLTMDENFDEVWNTLECDLTTAVEFEKKKRKKNQEREKRRVQRQKQKEEKTNQTGRLRLFEKEKPPKKATTQVKKRKNKLSSEFLEAIQKLFDENSDESATVSEDEDDSLDDDSDDVGDASVFSVYVIRDDDGEKSMASKKSHKSKGQKSVKSRRSASSQRSEHRDETRRHGSRSSHSGKKSRTRDKELETSERFLAEVEKVKNSKFLTTQSLRQEMADRRGTSVNLLKKEYATYKLQCSQKLAPSREGSSKNLNVAKDSRGVPILNFQGQMQSMFGKSRNDEIDPTEKPKSDGLGGRLSRWVLAEGVTDLDDLATVVDSPVQMNNILLLAKHAIEKLPELPVDIQDVVMSGAQNVERGVTAMGTGLGNTIQGGVTHLTHAVEHGAQAANHVVQSAGTVSGHIADAGQVAGNTLLDAGNAFGGMVQKVSAIPRGDQSVTSSSGGGTIVRPPKTPKSFTPKTPKTPRTPKTPKTPGMGLSTLAPLSAIGKEPDSFPTFQDLQPIEENSEDDDDGGLLSRSQRFDYKGDEHDGLIDDDDRDYGYNERITSDHQERRGSGSSSSKISGNFGKGISKKKSISTNKQGGQQNEEKQSGFSVKNLAKISLFKRNKVSLNDEDGNGLLG